VIPANDVMLKTRRGILRSSSGSVTYSATHRAKAEIDVKALAEILGGHVPGGGHAWTPQRLERIFQERTGRPGVWSHYEIGIKSFLAVFPKTFELFGTDGQYVQLRQKVATAVLDDPEEAMVRLAKAAKDPSSVTMRNGMRIALPELGQHRLKVAYQEDPSLARGTIKFQRTQNAQPDESGLED